MSALILSGIIFVLTLCGIFLGTLLRRALPKHHLNSHAAAWSGLDRDNRRSTIDPFADGLWREKEAGTTGPVETNAAAERVYLEIHKLSPHDDLQRLLKTRAVQISNDLAQVRFLLFVESENLIANPFLAVLALWLMIIFASFSLFSPLNGTVFTCLFLFALSAASAIFLIMELSRPFTGLMMISSTPLRNALGTI